MSGQTPSGVPMTLDEQSRIVKYVIDKQNSKYAFVIQQRHWSKEEWTDITQPIRSFNFTEYDYRPKPEPYTGYMVRGYYDGKFHPTFDRRNDAHSFVIKHIFKMQQPERDPDCTGIGGVTLPPDWPKESEVDNHIIEIHGEISPKW